MHIGNLRTCLFAYLIAKHNNGKFVLRIDNTDISREVAGSEEFVYQILNTDSYKFLL